LLIASTAYSEQVGVNLQLEGNIGDTAYLYVLIVAINSFFMVQSGNGPSYAPVQNKELSLRGCASRDHNNIVAQRTFCKQLPEDLPETALYPVPGHRVTDLLADSKANSAAAEAVGQYVEDKMFGRKFPALLKYDLEFALPSQGLKNGLLQTASFFRPFFLLLLITLRPPTVLILTRKPCVFFCFFVCG
jgi:hypothetical protein